MPSIIANEFTEANVGAIYTSALIEMALVLFIRYQLIINLIWQADHQTIFIR